MIYVYKFRCIEPGPDFGKFGDSSAMTKWSSNGDTIFLDRPASIKACQRQIRLATRHAPCGHKGFSCRCNVFPHVKAEIVKFQLTEC